MRRALETLTSTTLVLLLTAAAGAILVTYTFATVHSLHVREPCILSVTRLEDGSVLVYNPCRRSVNATLIPSTSSNGTCTVVVGNHVINTTRVTLRPHAAILVYGSCKGLLAEGRGYPFT